MKKKYILMMSLVLVVLIVLGVSYALLQKNIVGDSNKVIYQVGDLEVKLDETGSKDISLENALPTEDSDGLKNKSYNFSVINNSKTDLLYTIYLEDDTDAKSKCGSDCELMSKNYMKYSLEQADKTVVTSNLSSDKIYTGIIGGNAKNEFKLKLWLSIDADNNAMGKYYFGKLKVVIEQVGKEKINQLCKESGGDFVVDSECRKYYVKLNNFIKNSDFSDGTNGWALNDGAVFKEVSNSIVKIDCSKGTSSCGIYQNPLALSTLNHKYYIYQSIKSTSPTKFFVLGIESIYTLLAGTLKDNEWHDFSHILTYDENMKKVVDSGAYYAYIIYTQSEFSKEFYTRNPLFVDLTLMFGEGNEPSKEWCDKNLNSYIKYNIVGTEVYISDINYTGKTSYYDVIDIS